jgi:hypothetical protein
MDQRYLPPSAIMAVREFHIENSHTAYTEDRIRAFPLYRFLDAYLRWEGIINYTDAITSIARAYGAHNTIHEAEAVHTLITQINELIEAMAKMKPGEPVYAATLLDLIPKFKHIVDGLTMILHKEPDLG